MLTPRAYPGTAVLEEIQQRVLWLSTRIVDAANHDRDTGDGVKVGGHQASSASLVTVMTALYFAYLDAPDRVSVKPHASPVFHAIQYLLGSLDRSYLPALLDAFAACDAQRDRPSVLFAYTVKGWGLPIAGHPRNHSALLTPGQVDQLRAESGLRAGASTSTQEAFGRILVQLSRTAEVASYLVTTAPDVATSTNLAGFINRMGVFSPSVRRSWSEDPVLKWAEGPQGQHIELGISEMNLFLLLGQLGLAGDLSGQPLLPVGTVYDPFVLRGLDAFIYSVSSGARFVVAGTPSGVTLAPEGGAHQSTITASVGLELPNVTFIEPAYANALDWLLCGALQSVAAASPGLDAVLRRQVLAGAYRLVEPPAAAGAPQVSPAASGAVLPEVLAAAAELADEGIAATYSQALYQASHRTCSQPA